MFNRVLLALSLLSGLLLCYIAVAFVLYHHYKVEPPAVLARAFQGGITYYQEWQRGHISVLGEKEDRGKQQSLSKRLETMINTKRRVQWEVDQTYDGYTLMTYKNHTGIFLIDMKGDIVHSWDVPFKKAFPIADHVHKMVKVVMVVEDAHLYPNGDLLIQYGGLNDTPHGYGVARVDKDGKVIWAHADNNHHDLYIEPEGQGYIYTLSHHIIQDPIPGLEHMDYPSLMDYVVKLDPNTGEEVERVSITEALQKSPYAKYLKLKVEDEEIWDYFHTNSVEKLEPSMAKFFPMFKEGQILVSIRNLDLLIMLEMDTKNVTWATQGSWIRQHSAQFTPEGKIILFDNRGANTANMELSRVLALDPETKKVSVLFPTPSSDVRAFYTKAHGRVQRLPNGNLLVAEGLSVRVWEVAPGGKVVWRYALPPMAGIDAILSATRYTKDYIQFTPNRKGL